MGYVLQLRQFSIWKAKFSTISLYFFVLWSKVSFQMTKFSPILIFSKHVGLWATNHHLHSSCTNTRLRFTTCQKINMVPKIKRLHASCATSKVCWKINFQIILLVSIGLHLKYSSTWNFIDYHSQLSLLFLILTKFCECAKTKWGVLDFTALYRKATSVSAVNMHS